MAKSIYTQTVEDKIFIVTHDAIEYSFSMAKYLNTLTPEIANNEEKMVEWARKEGILHGLLWGGLRDEVIKQRAYVRLKDSNGDAIQLTDAKQEEIQKTITAHKPPIAIAPGAKAAKTITEKSLNNLTTEELERLMEKIQAKLNQE